MGAYPSVSSVPSTAIPKDIAHLKELFPDKFKVETTPNSDSVTLFANDGKLTLILVATNNASAVATALVIDESDIKAVIKRQKQSNAPKISEQYKNTIVQLPGGSVLVLVSPALLGSRPGRQRLAQTLTNYSTPIPIDDNAEQQKEIPTDSCSNSAVPSNPQSVDAMDSTVQKLSLGPYKLPSFPTLDFRLLQKEGLEPNFPLNSRTAVPFETDLFQGKVLFLLRPTKDPAQEDPYWNEKIWAHKQRRVIVQVQGKFKTKPQGDLFAGGEVQHPMKLGLLAKGLTKVLLKLLRTFYPTIHYSFGDDDEEGEMAHIVIPAYRFFERLVVTKPGETPPTLGEPFIEPPESIQARKSSNSFGDWDPDNTYSMSFYSMYLDLPTWSVVNIPMSAPMPLATFWGKSFLRILFYDRVAPESVKKHLPKYNNYGFVIQAQYLGSTGKSSRSQRAVDRVPDSDEERESDGTRSEPELSSGDERGILDWTEAPNRDAEVKASMPHSESQIFLVDDEDDEEEVFVFDANQFFDAEEYGASMDLEESNVTSSFLTHDSSLLLSVDNLCPAWIEMLVPRGNYGRTYALNLPNTTKTVFYKAEWVLDIFDSEVPHDNICSPRMSAAEKTRRHLGQLLATCQVEKGKNTPNSHLGKLQTLKTMYDDMFLQGKRPSNSMEKGKVHASCFLARALSDHHWLEEWATITERGVNFYHPQRKRANHQVAIRTITRVQKVAPEQAPCFPGYFFLSFETLGRASYLMFASQAERDNWVKAISRLAKLTPSAVDSMETGSDGNASTTLIELQNPKDEFLHKSSMWDFKHRRVLNCRRFSFRSRSRSAQNNPLALAEDALRKALDPRNESDDDILVSFLDSAAKLKEAQVHDLDEQERLAFFLNVYHVMVMHAYLVLGTPRSSFQWISYFNSISYQCSDDIFSLAELEHCIIRSAMSFPTQFLSRFVLPKSTYDFALTKPDFRINFALNCGSRSNPKCVPVFKPASLNQQLDECSRLCLSAAVKVKKRNSREVEVFLPRICLWFSNDFGSCTDYVLQRVKPFMTKDVQDFLASCMSRERGKIRISVKFLQFDFECRKLTLTPNSG